ncbi:hypothetical protein Ddye_016015 [Dipteronia dyeriana]|uniref:Uncharacterized protein n=1 Tax=Dipteronia dyeriana TaxID=168575 RepID=A0AAD9WZ25_9ROSI|nr:hypothetical protein Ddye_016015 [Dipteronia dyeriana]
MQQSELSWEITMKLFEIQRLKRIQFLKLGKKMRSTESSNWFSVNHICGGSQSGNSSHCGRRHWEGNGSVYSTGTTSTIIRRTSMVVFFPDSKKSSDFSPLLQRGHFKHVHRDKVFLFPEFLDPILAIQLN